MAQSDIDREHAAKLAARELNRLTGEDRDRIRSSITECLEHWRVASINRRPVPIGAIELDTLNRVAHHSIGCTALDLRDAELAEIAAMVTALAGESSDPFNDYAGVAFIDGEQVPR